MTWKIALELPGIQQLCTNKHSGVLKATYQRWPLLGVVVYYLSVASNRKIKATELQYLSLLIVHVARGRKRIVKGLGCHTLGGWHQIEFL